MGRLHFPNRPIDPGSYAFTENQPTRRSARLQGVKSKAPPDPDAVPTINRSSLKRKRAGEPDPHPPNSATTSTPPPKKRPRTSPLPPPVYSIEEQIQQSPGDNDSLDPLHYWVAHGRWPPECFEQDSQVIRDIENGRSPPEELDERQIIVDLINSGQLGMLHAFHPVQALLRKKRSSASLGPRSSQATSQTPSDQQPRENKSRQYMKADYRDALEKQGSYMRADAVGAGDSSKGLCRTLLENEQPIPQDTLFRDDLFEETCYSIEDRNEAMVVRDILPLICPPAQTLRIFGAKHLSILYETVNEGWNKGVTFCGTRPQPDYSVGFRRTAFTDEQQDKLEAFVGPIGSSLQTFFMATTRMYFPFLTCEVKCGAAALDIADRQNAHSMSVAARGIVELFKTVKRHKELDRRLLTFSISHDHRSVRIYGHYPVIDGDEYTFYRYPIDDFSITAGGGRARWLAYKFVKSVYDIHSIALHKDICSVIDDLPRGIDFSVSQSAGFSESAGCVDGQDSSAMSVQSMDAGSQSSMVGSEAATPTSSFTQTTQRLFKKPKKWTATGGNSKT
ncbi:MAG: hypothetical protein LQ346_005998 [Caloplaca aetnensis]|nr:MAG: hypothetical protein LQ346_005998 [Caloplaca aetnensis]